MIAREDASKLLEGLDYLTQSKASNWKGMPRGAFLYSLTQIFLTEDINEIKRYLSEIIKGEISPNVIPQEIYEKAQKQGIPPKSLEQNVQKQKSYIHSWLKSVKSKPNIEESIKTQVKAAEAAAKIERETSSQKQPKYVKKAETKQKQEEVVVEKDIPLKESIIPTIEEKKAEVAKDVKTQTEEKIIPVTGEREIEKEVAVGQKLENIQIKFDSSEVGSPQERLNATQPFLVASAKSQQSEFIDLNPSLNLISKGISSETLNNASNSLPDSPEKNTIHRISDTMRQIEKIFPNEISQIRNFMSIDNLEVQISKVHLNPSPNNLLLSPNTSPLGGYSISDGSSAVDTIADFAKNKVINKASSAIISKIKTKIGGKLTKPAVEKAASSLTAKLSGTAVGKAASSLTAKLSGTAVGKALSAVGAKIGAALGSVAPIIGTILGAIVGAITGWLVEKLLPLINKIKKWLKENGQAILATAATVIVLPFYYVASSVLVPILIILIAIPTAIAIIMFIINSGAYIVPPKGGANIPGQDSISPYIEVTKTANPAGPFENSDLPLTIEYTVKIKAKKSGLTNIQILDNCMVTKKNSSPPCPPLDPGTKIPSGDEIPESITSSQPFSFKYKRSYSSPTFEDSLVVDTISVIADAPEMNGAEAASSAIIKIGKPPEQCPSGWPVSGVYYLTQGPGGNYSHKLCQAIDIAMPNGTPIKATHSGIATVVYTTNAYRPLYVDLISTCNGKQFTSRYAHLTSASVTTGKSVTKGQTIGNSGSDGTGPHLHYEFRGGLPMNVPYIPKSVPANCNRCMTTD